MDRAGREPLLTSGAHHTIPAGNTPDLSAFQPVYASQEGEGHLSEWAEERYAQGSWDTKPSVPPIETASLATANEIRVAALQDPYPQWIYGALVTPEATSKNTPQLTQDQHAGHIQEDQQRSLSVQGLTDEEIRELLTDYVGRQGCWGARPAHEWPISKVEDCNVYIGTLETFIEEREVKKQVKPYSGGQVDDKSPGPSPGPWEVDMRHEFPLLFTPSKEARQKLPHSEAVERCPECSGGKEVACPICNKNKDLVSYAPGQTTECPLCHGRGLLAHQDGSDSMCLKCQGKGRLPCVQCKSRGLVTCGKCQGTGALLEGKELTVTWSTLKTKKISASSNATLVPDDIFHEAKGVQLYSSDSYQCQPVNFPNSSGLTKLSSDVITDRSPVPPVARVICERHQMHMIPVTRVSVAQGKSSFKFFIVGLEKRVYIKDYPARPVGPGALVGAGVVLSFIAGLVFLWKLTRRPRHVGQFIVRS